MKLDGEELPASVVQTWQGQLDRLTQPAIRLLAAGRPTVMQGFRPASIDTSVVRDRLKAAMTRSAELPADFRAQLHGSGLASSLLAVLSEEALAHIHLPLASFFGSRETEAALWLDKRPAVRALAAKLAGTPNLEGSAAPGSSVAAATLAAEIGPFLAHMQALTAALDAESHGIGPATAIGPAPAPRVVRTQQEAQQVLVRRKLRQAVTRLTRERDQLKSLLAPAVAQAEQSRADLASALEQKNVAQQALALLQAQFDARLAEELQAHLDDRLLPWLRPAEALATAAAALGLREPASQPFSSADTAPQEHPAVQQALQALQSQARADRQHGLRSALRAEHHRCVALQTRLHEAQLDALRPLPDLKLAMQGLEDRIQQIHRALGQGTSSHPAESGPALGRLTQAIAGAQTLDDLVAMRQGLIASEPLGLLDEPALQQAHRSLDQALSRVYAQAGANRGRMNLRGLPLFALKAALAQRQPCSLVVDGHNVLWKLPTLFKQHHENGIPGSRARAALQAALLTLARQQPGLDLHLWFDGSVMEDRTLAPNLRVHFSGGHGANRADGRMLAYLTYLGTQGSGGMRAVVTADQDVATSAQASGAMALAPQELALWLA